MGITSLLYAAKEFSKETHLRSVIFLATTGEEEGMQGSSYFINNCPVPLNAIVFVLNNDGGGYNDTTLIRIGGKNEINFPSSLWEKPILV
jgi:Zn-dependent M28 family amino/carboxypeptidase